MRAAIASRATPANSAVTASSRARESPSSSQTAAFVIVDTGTGIAPTRIAAR